MGLDRTLCLCAFVAITFGVSGQQHSTRILNGSPTSIVQYPIMAQLLLDSWGNQQFTQYCAGVILTIRHVISTAHCFHVNMSAGKNYSQPQFWKIRVGSSYRTKGGSLHNVKTIVTHPSFDKVYYNNDIAIVTAVGNFNLGDRVKQGTVPKQGSDVADETTCTIVGWGAKKFNGPQANKLQVASLKIIHRDMCNTRYQTIKAKITEAMLCAGILDQGTVDGCYGDSGGPLICNGLVVGLVSFGYACGNPYYPGVYTRISTFTNWIVQTVSSLSK